MAVEVYNKTWDHIVKEYQKGNAAVVLIIHMSPYSLRYGRLKLFFYQKKDMHRQLNFRLKKDIKTIRMKVDVVKFNMVERTQNLGQ